jgi:protein-S-isoprenylcysteine O-methyltransferase Ste14
MKPNADRAKIIVPPPVFAAVGIGLGFLARHFEPLHLLAVRTAWQHVIGGLLIVVAIALLALAHRNFIAHGTHPNPYAPTKALVTDGLYGFSRNPIYVAFLLVVLAFTFFANSLWFVAAAAVSFSLLHFIVVKREEEYLSAKFGGEYRDYCRRVRRWI